MIVHDHDPMWLQAAVGIFLFHSICTAFILHHEPISIQPSAGSLTHQSPHSSRHIPKHCNAPAQDKAFSKNTCSGPAASHPIPRYPSALSLKPSSLNLSSSTTTILFLPNEFLDQLFSKTPRSTTWTSSPSAQYAAPSTRPQQENTPTAASHPPRYRDYHCFGTSTIMPFPLIMSRELSDEMALVLGKSCLYIKRLGVMGRGYIEKMGELR